MSHEEIRAALAACPLLSGCGIAPEHAAVKRCKKGQIVGDRLNGEEVLGVVVSGGVEVYSIALDGREVMLSRLGAGECFGIINLFTQAELPTVLRCSADTTLVMVPKARVVRAMEVDAGLTLRYAQICNRKLQFLIRKIEFLTMQSGRNKLIQHLLMREDERGRIRLDGTKESLAAVLGVSRASLFRELAALQEAGMIAQEPGCIRVLDRDRLEAALYG